MPSCLPPRYRLLDLLFALCGTVAFVWDFGTDVWSAVSYYKSGDPVFAALHFGLYVVSSLVLQLLSWGWFWADWKDWAAEATSERKAANGHPGVNGLKSPEGTEERGCSVCRDKQPTDDTACHHESVLQANGDTQQATVTTRAPMPDTPLQGPEDEEPTFLTNFYTSRIWLRPPCLSILHVLQLGYPFR